MATEMDAAGDCRDARAEVEFAAEAEAESHSGACPRAPLPLYQSDHTATHLIDIYELHRYLCGSVVGLTRSVHQLLLEYSDRVAHWLLDTSLGTGRRQQTGDSVSIVYGRIRFALPPEVSARMGDWFDTSVSHQVTEAVRKWREAGAPLERVPFIESTGCDIGKEFADRWIADFVEGAKATTTDAAAAPLADKAATTTATSTRFAVAGVLEGADLVALCKTVECLLIDLIQVLKYAPEADRCAFHNRFALVQTFDFSGEQADRVKALLQFFGFVRTSAEADSDSSSSSSSSASSCLPPSAAASSSAAAASAAAVAPVPPSPSSSDICLLSGGGWMEKMEGHPMVWSFWRPRPWPFESALHTLFPPTRELTYKQFRGSSNNNRDEIDQDEEAQYDANGDEIPRPASPTPKPWYTDAAKIAHYADMYARGDLPGGNFWLTHLHIRPVEWHGWLDDEPDPRSELGVGLGEDPSELKYEPLEYNAFRYVSFDLIDADGREFSFMGSLRDDYPDAPGGVKQGTLRLRDTLGQEVVGGVVPWSQGCGCIYISPWTNQLSWYEPHALFAGDDDGIERTMLSKYRSVEYFGSETDPAIAERQVLRDAKKALRDLDLDVDDLPTDELRPSVLVPLSPQTESDDEKMESEEYPDPEDNGVDLETLSEDERRERSMRITVVRRRQQLQQQELQAARRTPEERAAILELEQLCAVALYLCYCRPRQGEKSTFWSANQPMAVRVRFTEALLQRLFDPPMGASVSASASAIESESKSALAASSPQSLIDGVRLPTVLLHLIAEYAPADLPDIDDRTGRVRVDNSHEGRYSAQGWNDLLVQARLKREEQLQAEQRRREWEQYQQQQRQRQQNVEADSASAVKPSCCVM